MGKILQMAPEGGDNTWTQGYDTGYSDGYQAGLKAVKKKQKPPEETERGREAKECLNYFHDSYLRKLREKPTICGAKEIKLLKILLRNNDVPAVKEAIDGFFDWDRADYTLGRFFERFDVVRLKLRDINGGRR